MKKSARLLLGLLIFAFFVFAAERAAHFEESGRAPTADASVSRAATVEPAALPDELAPTERK